MARSSKKSRDKFRVAIVMGSASDWRVMKEAAEALKQFGIPFDRKIVSAHRTPKEMYAFAEKAEEKGYRVIIAGAGGAAHLPGMIASITTIPVIGVPVALQQLNGVDSLLSICQMPKGVPVATVAINGAYNAGVLSAQVFAAMGLGSLAKLAQYKARLRKKVLKMKLPR